MIGGVPGAEHPLIAANRADAPPHLVGQRLKAEVVIRRRQRAADRVTWAVAALDMQKGFDGFLEAAVQEVRVTFEWDGAVSGFSELAGNVEAVNRIQKNQGADAFVEVVT